MFPVVSSMRSWGKITSRNQEQCPVPIYLVNKDIDTENVMIQTHRLKHVSRQ